jgi:hypothetical protein
MKQQSKLPQGKVVPFTGEFYPVPEPQPTTPNLTGAYFVLVAAAMVAGLSIGAIVTYQRSDQVQLRQLQADRASLNQVKSQVCKE